MALCESSLLLRILSWSVGLYVAHWLYTEFAVKRPHRRLMEQHGCKPPKTMNPGFFGLAAIPKALRVRRERRVLESLDDAFIKAGSGTFQTSVFGMTETLTMEPENLKTILSLDFESWGIGSIRTDFLPMFGEGIFSSDGPAWQHSRNMLRPAFVRSQVADLSMFEDHIRHFLRHIPFDSSTVDLQPLFFNLSLDIATDFLFGQSSSLLAPVSHSKIDLQVAEAFNRGVVHLGSGFGPFGHLIPNWQFRRDCKLVHGDPTSHFALGPWSVLSTDSYTERIDALVASALAAHSQNDKSDRSDASERYVFLDELLKQTQDKVKIRSELLNILLAGRDTTASLLSNVWFELSKRPSVWQQLRIEVDALQGEIPSFEQLRNMTYLRAVVNESMRLYPIVPANTREALRDTVIPFGGGEDGSTRLFVPKGRYLSWSTYSMHRRKDIFGEDAKDFRPERWIDTEEQKGIRPGWGFLPFNGGARVCIGQQFALTEAEYITVRLMQEFQSLESRDPEPWREMLMLTCTGFGGCKVALSR